MQKFEIKVSGRVCPLVGKARYEKPDDYRSATSVVFFFHTTQLLSDCPLRDLRGLWRKHFERLLQRIDFCLPLCLTFFKGNFVFSTSSICRALWQ